MWSGSSQIYCVDCVWKHDIPLVIECTAVPFFSPNQRTTQVCRRRLLQDTQMHSLSSAAVHLAPVTSCAPVSFAGWERKEGLLFSLL